MNYFIFLLALSLLGSVASSPADIFRQSRAITAHALNLKGSELIDYVNSNQNLWKAGKPKKSRDEMLRTIMDSKYGKPASGPRKAENPGPVDIPASFDAREMWPACVSIARINDQSECKSSWAFAATESMSDRHCITTGATINTTISAQELLSCCSGVLECGEGCNGGFALAAWNYWVKHGLVSGGSYESQDGCQPYSIAPCGKTVNGETYPACRNQTVSTPSCAKKCTSKNDYPVDFNNDKHFGKAAATLSGKQAALQNELMDNGPFQATFEIYDDFLQYTSGIYVHTAGEKHGSQSVRVIGWGTADGVPYWLLANSWGSDWGENGFFRILRGINECGIEANCVSGTPNLNK